MTSQPDFLGLSKLVRYHILTCTSAAGSGHPTTSLSATDLITVLFFGHLKYDLDNPQLPNNDRLIFSKGHAAPLYFSLFAAAGKISEKEMLDLRKFDSPLEGHPTPRFVHAEVAAGSLGQGLSIGVGMAINAKFLDKLPYRTFVLMGDGEMAEGSVWEAAQLASHYKLDNLIAFVDVNRLGQSRDTMAGHDVDSYANKLRAFGWEVVTLDGHDLEAISKGYNTLFKTTGKPKAIVAKTLKGKGVSFLEDKEGWHGKALKQADLEKALKEVGSVGLRAFGAVQKPENLKPKRQATREAAEASYAPDEKIATRKVYGRALSRLIAQHPDIVALDGDTSNSTFSEIVRQNHPDHFFEMFIAEQNMVGVALGLSKRGKIPFASTFSAFLTRAFDQVRMAAVSRGNFKLVGSHAGVAIGEDGPSQMGLEDLSMFRSINGSTVLYPSDAYATEALVEQMIKRPGVVYMRTNRPETPILYKKTEKFPIGGSKTLRTSSSDRATVVAAGVTLNEALTAHDLLKKEGISIRVVDCYSVKPIDEKTLQKAAKETKAILVVEDHWYDGGIGDAVLSALAEKPSVPVYKMAVRKMPRSGKPAELLDASGISAAHIVRKVKELN